MTALTQREYLRKIAPDFSVLEMLEHAYYQGQTNLLTENIKSIFYYPDNHASLYRAIFLFDEPEAANNKYFMNNSNFVYEVYNFGDRYVAIAILINRLAATTQNAFTDYIKVNHSDFTKNVFGVGF
jgi:hypothetical protein